MKSARWLAPFVVVAVAPALQVKGEGTLLFDGFGNLDMQILSGERRVAIR